TFGFLVFRVEGTDPSMQQIAEVGRGRAGTVFLCGAVGIETPARLGFRTRHVAPADLLCVMQDAGLDGLVLSGRGHVIIPRLRPPVQGDRGRGPESVPSLTGAAGYGRGLLEISFCSRV